MRPWTRLTHIFLGLLLAIGASAAHATFHLWRVTQLFSNADGSVQFIELQAYGAGEQYLAGHTIVATQGAATHAYTFPTNLPGDTATNSEGGYYGGMMTTYKSMLIGTQGFAALGIVAPDYVVPNGFLFTSGGTVNYGEGADAFSYPALPTDGQTAWNRGGSTGAASPMNFDDMSGTMMASNMPGPLSGLWWDAAESGWGIDFTQRRDVIFAAWYTYDANGNPKWYVASNCAMPGAGMTSGTCSGTLYEVNGPAFFGAAFNSAAVNVAPAGSLSVTFQNASTASVTYTLGSQSRTVAITRQPISSGAMPGVDHTDLWWNPNESGWGMAVAQQGSVMFLAWYVYDSSGKPMWYVASNCAVSGAGCSGTLYRTTGPAFGPTFDPARVQAFPVGTATLTFGDSDNGTLSYTVDGVSGTKAIKRQLF